MMPLPPLSSRPLLRFSAEHLAPKHPVSNPPSTPSTPPTADEVKAVETSKKRLFKRGQSLALKLISHIPGFGWVSYFEKLEPKAIKSKLKNTALWTGVYLAGASIPLYSGYQWYSHAGQIGKLRQHHTETATRINEFTSAAIPSMAPAPTYFQQASSWIGMGSTPASLQKALIEALPDSKRGEAQQILDTLAQQDKPSDADYKAALKSFITLINRDNQLDTGNQSLLEKEMTESFEQNAGQFTFPAFQAPKDLDTTRHRYMMMCLLGTVAVGALVATRTGYTFAMAKVELAQSLRETVQDATTVINDYRKGQAATKTESSKTPDEPAA